MTDRYRSGESRGISKKSIFLGLCLGLLVFLAAVLQTGDRIRIFGMVPAITFALVCAVGFICGKRMGAVIGIFAAVVTDALGASGATLTILLYFLCGYLCGAMAGWFLSTNLLSFIVYSAITGLVRAGVTILYITLHSDSYALKDAIVGLILPEYFAYILCVIPAYFAVLGINKLFNLKDKKDYRV